MKPIAIAVLAAFIATPVCGDDDPKKVQESLQGEWQAVESVRYGEPELKEDVEDIKLIFKDNKVWQSNKPKEVATFALDPKANPSAIDLKPDSKRTISKASTNWKRTSSPFASSLRRRRVIDPRNSNPTRIATYFSSCWNA